MRIEEIHFEDRDDLRTARATVIWEDCDRSPQEIYFGVPLEFGEYLSCNAHTFILGSILPAANAGERRIAIKGAICPSLREGLITAMSQFFEWYGPKFQMPQVEAEGTFVPVLPNDPRNTACFLSGGIDSLALLRANHLDYPANHIGSIKRCIFVYGFDMGGKADQTEALYRTVDSLTKVSEDTNTELIPVHTNLRSLNDGLDFWMYQFHGAALAAVAHSLAPIIKSISIGATYDLKNLHPWGSHPLIDPHYSSSGLQVNHVGARHSRFSKTKIVADWETGFQNIRVCAHIYSALKASSNAMNCGKCEKCIRTMTALVALGKLAYCRAFPANNVTKKLVKSVVIISDYQRTCYEELIEPLHMKGRDDLVQAIRRIILTYRVKQTAKGMDKRLCGGKVLAYRKAARKKAKTALLPNSLIRRVHP